MKKIDLGQTIGILANLGVVAGIVFLAIEIGQNNAQLSSQSRFNYYQTRFGLNAMIAQDGDLADIVSRAVAGEELTRGEAVQARQVTELLFGMWEYEFGEFEAGNISLEDFDVIGKRRTFGGLGEFGVAGWESYGSAAPQRFVAYVNENIIGR